VTQTLRIKLADLKNMPRTTVTLGEDGQRISYEGVLVGELLRRAGAPVGRDLSGKAVATFIRATAKDGYQVRDRFASSHRTTNAACGRFACFNDSRSSASPSSQDTGNSVADRSGSIEGDHK
jgi:hypothetical protein